MSTVHPSAIAAAFISTGIISLAPNVLLFLFPNFDADKSDGRSILSIGQALAVGGLLGDVFIHTLPECYAESLEDSHIMHHHKDNTQDVHHHHHHHNDSSIGLNVIFGFTAFLILDLFVRSIEDKSGVVGHHNHGHSTKSVKSKSMRTDKNQWRIILSSSVLLNLLGDALHNFTDGLAIGATYSLTQIPQTTTDLSFISLSFILVKSRGGLASISVFLHEIPHELGDFATLVRAGLSRNTAICLQFMTAIAALLGTAFGLFSGQIIEGLNHEVLLPFIAGGFIYLSCVNILPDVLETESSFFLRCLQVCSFLLGIGFMYAVAELEELEGEQHHHTEL